MNALFSNAKLVVVKVGSSLLVDGTTGQLRRDWLISLCADVAALRQSGVKVILVSSGSIALGRNLLGLPAGSLRLEESQASAAAGQVRLAQAYSDLLAKIDLVAAQILLTLGDTEERDRYLNARATLNTLLDLGAVPVINENDTVATAEIRFGDNDRLGARVASMMGADKLILLSDIDGLYTANPARDVNARHIPEVTAITPEIEAMGGGSVSGLGRGGMVSKLIAAKIATGAGCDVIIARGEGLNPVMAVANGGRHTIFRASLSPALAKKRWIAGGLNPVGTLMIDDGAVSALKDGKSLLPAGVRQVDGRFERGDTVLVKDRQGREIARGLAAYNASDAERIAGKRTVEIEAILGYRGRDEMIHRDDLALKFMTLHDKHDALNAEMMALGASARDAARAVREADDATKTKALREAARAIRARKHEILAANVRDLTAAKEAGMAAPLMERLALNDARIEAMAKGVEDVAAQADPNGRELARWTRPNGLDIARIATPIGVIGIIYESRPNVTADAGAIALKAGNVAILRGGSDSVHSSSAIHVAMVEGLKAAGLPEASIQYVRNTDRAAVGLMLEGLNGTIDLIIPRGGKGLTGRVMREARVPVLAHLEGLCHVYVHEKADKDMARKVVLNAKMRRTSVCGAAETLLLDRAILKSHGVPILEDLAKAGCEIRGDEAVRAVFAAAKPATEEDWRTEYLDAIVAVKVVDGVQDAIHHIEHYGSHHTDSILTEDAAVAETFLNALDSAIVLWNASTQFADGGEFGMGAEIGIGTGKLHARGPVGVEQLTTFKYVVRGTGQIRP